MMQQTAWCNFTVIVQKDDDYAESYQADDYQPFLAENDAASNSYSDEENEELEDDDFTENAESPSTPSSARPRPPTFTRPKKMEQMIYVAKPAGSTVTYKCPADGESIERTSKALRSE